MGTLTIPPNLQSVYFQAFSTTALLTFENKPFFAVGLSCTWQDVQQHPWLIPGTSPPVIVVTTKIVFRDCFEECFKFSQQNHLSFLVENHQSNLNCNYERWPPYQQIFSFGKQIIQPEYPLTVVRNLEFILSVIERWASQVAQWVKNLLASAGDANSNFYICNLSWVRKIPWRRAKQATPVFLPGESHGQRSLADYSPQGLKELDTIEATEHACMHACDWKVLG